jgi:hypothetical protein
MYRGEFVSAEAPEYENREALVDAWQSLPISNAVPMHRPSVGPMTHAWSAA